MRHSRLIRLVPLFFAALLALGATGAMAQIPDHFTNLQVLPKEISKSDLLVAMRAWSRALGMHCDGCHVESEKDHKMDFPSDAKEEKKTARQMLKMVMAINKDYIAALPSHNGEHAASVGCFTCHRGQNEPPQALDDTIARIANEKGPAAALARYQELRKDHLIDGRYDFSERSLLSVAANLAESEKYDDSMAIIKADLELFPTSSNLYTFQGRLQVLKKDKAGAEASFKKALELDPKNDNAKRSLAALQSPPPPPKPPQ
jgi:tetratricopeptide (TPR) repeat protein